MARLLGVSLGSVFCSSVFLLIAAPAASGEDALLRQVLTAFEGAHRAHDLAQKACSLPAPQPGKTLAVNWDSIEKQTRELMNKATKPSEIISSVLPALSFERAGVFDDFVACHPAQISASKALADALQSLNWLDVELGQELWHRVWATEKGSEYLNRSCNTQK